MCNVIERISGKKIETKIIVVNSSSCQDLLKCAEENISAEIKRMSLVCSIMRSS